MPAKLTPKQAKEKFNNKVLEHNVPIEADYSKYENAKLKNIQVVCNDVLKHKSGISQVYLMDHANLTHPSKKFGCPECEDWYNGHAKSLDILIVRERINSWISTYGGIIDTVSGEVEVYKNNSTKIPYICKNGTKKTLTISTLGDEIGCNCSKCKSELISEIEDNNEYTSMTTDDDCVTISHFIFGDDVAFSWISPLEMKKHGYGLAEKMKEKALSVGKNIIGYAISSLSEWKNEKTPVITEHEGVLYRISRASYLINNNIVHRPHYTKNNFLYYFYKCSPNNQLITPILIPDDVGTKKKIKVCYKSCGCEYDISVDVIMNRNLKTCGNCKNIDTKTFIEKCLEFKSSGEYIYDRVNYINQSTPVTIVHKIYGEFKSTPQNHLTHLKNSLKYDTANFKIKNLTQFKIKANEVHNNLYNYDKVDYVNSSTKVLITHPVYGDFWQTPASHLCGSGHPLAAGHSQQYAYIHNILDGDLSVALKYGIEKQKGKRVMQQNKKSLFKIESLHTYFFTSVFECKEAEKECKKLFGKGVLTKQEMPDGYTETTTPNNIDKIIAIYEKWGGVKKN